jgi:hypothetical protein
VKGLQQKDEKKEYVTTIENRLTVGDLHAKAKTSDYDLLGFNAGKDDDEYVERRGGRGGRGGRGRGDRAGPVGDRADRGAQRGGRKGGKLVVNDNEFPSF